MPGCEADGWWTSGIAPLAIAAGLTGHEQSGVLRGRTERAASLKVFRRGIGPHSDVLTRSLRRSEICTTAITVKFAFWQPVDDFEIAFKVFRLYSYCVFPKRRRILWPKRNSLIRPLK
jgi:hypothetical protein